jgi:hypothetical protein
MGLKAELEPNLKSVPFLTDETLNLGLNVDLSGQLQDSADNAENYLNHFLAGYVLVH